MEGSKEKEGVGGEKTVGGVTGGNKKSIFKWDCYRVLQGPTGVLQN